MRLEGLNRAPCAAKIERAVKALPGVKEASLNFFTARLVIESADDDMERLAAAATAIVHKFEPDVAVS